MVCSSQMDSRFPGLLICEACAAKHKITLNGIGTANSDLWKAFRMKELGAMGMTHQELQAHLKSLIPRDEASDNLLSHAKLYVFADKYDIRSLRALCLHKLHRDLLAFRVQHDSIADVVALMKYTYENTLDIDEDVAEVGDGSDLRDLVILYAACNAETLVKSKEFRNLLRDGGKIASDYACTLAKRLTQ